MAVASATTLNTPLFDKDGRLNRAWQQLFLQWRQQLSVGFDSSGTLISNISPTVRITDRGGTIGSILRFIGDNGVVTPDGLPPATDNAQGAVKLAPGIVSNILGTAAAQDSSAFDPAGSAATAQANAEAFATSEANAALAAAETFASNASNLTSGTVPNARLGGMTVTVTTAALTVGGTQGSMDFVNGLLVSQVQAT